MAPSDIGDITTDADQRERDVNTIERFISSHPAPDSFGTDASVRREIARKAASIFSALQTGRAIFTFDADMINKLHDYMSNRHPEIDENTRPRAVLDLIMRENQAPSPKNKVKAIDHLLRNTPEVGLMAGVAAPAMLFIAQCQGVVDGVISDDMTNAIFSPDNIAMTTGIVLVAAAMKSLAGRGKDEIPEARWMIALNGLAVSGVPTTDDERKVYEIIASSPETKALDQVLEIMVPPTSGLAGWCGRLMERVSLIGSGVSAAGMIPLAASSTETHLLAVALPAAAALIAYIAKEAEAALKSKGALMDIKTLAHAGAVNNPLPEILGREDEDMPKQARFG